MNEINQSRFTSYVNPDALRQYTRLSKNLFDSYTKKYFGYEDINGSYYNGTVENWGSEMLLESRKILLDKPSLKNIFVENTMDFYFDIQYSEYINTYDQQNMLCAVLRKDVLLSNKEYRLLFENITKTRIPRSESWSDPVVYNNDYYIMTKTPPKLLIDGDAIELKLTDVDSGNTTYYFSLGLNTRDLYDEIDEENNTLTTNPITNSMNGFPLIWICVDMLRILPDISFENNYFDNKQLLTIGTNGHDRAMIFPMLNHDSSIFNCMLKVIPAVYDGFVEDRDTPMNYSSKIKEIHLLIYDNWLIDPSQQPLEDYCITYDDTYAKICLNDFVGTINIEDPIFENIIDTTNINQTLMWNFKRPQQGDYDYSDKRYKNSVYAYAPLYAFYQNTITEGKVSLTPGFIVKFDDKYLHEYEGMMENATAGIHIDITADKSNNGVIKKNGTIYSMGDFDGLPSYFKYMIDDTIHRAHVELYAIRDKLNDINQKPVDKQTSAVILDSGIPQNELNLSYKDLKLCIFYDTESLIGRHFSYIEENINKRNNLSDVVFVDKDNFGTAKQSKYMKNKKFIYHGNRHFSLGMVGFDPDLELGRVYIASNDKSIYENNDEVANKKAPLTFARICDIPTSFAQLISIKGISPMFPFDKDYVRTEVSFNNIDKHMLLNIDTPRSQVRWIKPTNLDKIFSTETAPSYCKVLLNQQYPVYVNLNEKIHLSISTNVTYSIESQGTNYEVGDMCSFYIGGICIKFTVTQVDNGAVTEIKFGNDASSDYPVLSYDEIALSNFNSRITIYGTENISSNGEELTISCEINEDLWNSKIQKTVNRTESRSSQDSFYFKWDKYKNIHVLIYDYKTKEFVDNEIIMGVREYENSYDVKNNNVIDVLLYNLIQPISNDFIKSIDYSVDILESSIPSSTSLDVDMSDDLNNLWINKQNSLFYFNTDTLSDNYTITRSNIDLIVYEQNHLEKFDSSDLNVQYYINSTNKFRYHDPDDSYVSPISNKNGFQPILHIYDPTLSTITEYVDISKDVIAINNEKPKMIIDCLPTNQTIIDQDGFLTQNLYRYDEFSISKKYDQYRDELSTKSRDELINIIINEYGNNATPLLYEDSDNRYSINRLIDYIIERTYKTDIDIKCTSRPETVYRKPDISLFRSKNEQVQHSNDIPVGEQPTGGFIEVTSSLFDNKVNLKNNTLKTKPLYLFKIDDIHDADELTGFKIIDEWNIDVSSNAILIMDGVLYSCDVDNGYKWIPVNRNITKEVII